MAVVAASASVKVSARRRTSLIGQFSFAVCGVGMTLINDAA
jgi:hypothetical protein